MYNQYQCVCKICSQLFYSEDEEMTYCSKCWINYLKSQLDKQSYIKLDKVYLEKNGFLTNNSGG